MSPKLIIVTGLPASGKSWLAEELARKLRIPNFPKDGIKVEILAHLGVRDRAWDIQAGTAAVKIQILVAVELLSRGLPVILESTFKEEYDTPLFLKIIEQTGCECLQIVCGAEGPTLIERYLTRTASGTRPKEFNEAFNTEEFRGKLQKGYTDPLALPGKLIRIDTTDFHRVDLPAINAEVEEFLAR